MKDQDQTEETLGSLIFAPLFTSHAKETQTCVFCDGPLEGFRNVCQACSESAFRLQENTAGTYPVDFQDQAVFRKRHVCESTFDVHERQKHDASNGNFSLWIQFEKVASFLIKNQASRTPSQLSKSEWILKPRGKLPASNVAEALVSPVHARITLLVPQVPKFLTCPLCNVLSR